MRHLPLFLLLLAPAAAEAGGYYYPDSGIVAYGRGGAWVAGADDQFAQYYNPAGLVRIERPVLNVGLSGVQQNTRFTRKREDPDDDEGPFFPTVENQESPFLVPQLGFAAPVGQDMAFALGFTSPFAPGSLYAEDGAQRYTIIDTLIWNFQIGPSFAWRPVEQLSVGVGLQWQFLRVEEKLNVTTSGTDNPAGDVGVEARVWDKFTPGANAGLLVEPVDEVSIGLSVQPPVTFKGRGTGTLDFSEWGGASLLDETVYTDDDVALNLQLPLVVRAGVAVRPVPTLEIELAGVWERWSSLEDILVEDIDVTVQSEALGPQEVEDTISLPAGFNDVVSIRLGGEYQVSDVLELRAGTFYETSSLKPQVVSVALYDTKKVQVSAGASIWAVDQRLRMDVAAGYLFLANQEIRDSEVTQINVYGGDEQVVGNGDYESSGWMTGLQLSWLFGASSSPAPAEE